jgi:hypothetical protein
LRTSRDLRAGGAHVRSSHYDLTKARFRNSNGVAQRNIAVMVIRGSGHEAWYKRLTTDHNLKDIDIDPNFYSTTFSSHSIQSLVVLCTDLRFRSTTSHFNQLHTKLQQLFYSAK